MGTNRGFTLIEVLVTLFIASVSMTVLTMYCLTQQKSTVVSTNVSDMQQSLRAAMAFIIRDIRMAGYDPTASKNFGFLDIAFRDYEGSADTSGDDFLQLAWDANEDGVRDDDEIISYSLSDNSTAAPDSLALTREVDSGGGRQPLAGYIVQMSFAFAIDNDQDGALDEDSSGNVLWLVDSDSDGSWDKLDVNGDGDISAADNGGSVGTIAGTDIGVTVSTRDIRAVRIWLLARSAAPDNDFTDTDIYVVGRDVVQPNDRYRHRLMERSVLCRNAGLSL